MTTALTHTFQSHPIRTVLIDGDPWWVATDIAELLGYRDARDATRGLDDDEKGTHRIRTPGGDQTVLVVSESGLHALMLRSRRPEAQPFRKWVTSEVLPAIRRTGQYGLAPIIPSHSEALRGWADAMDRQAALTAQVQALQPAAAFVEDVAASGDTRTPRRVSSILRMKEADLFALLKAKGWAYRDPGTNRWVATKARIHSGDLVMVPSTRERRKPDGTREKVLDDEGRPRTDETMHFTGKGFVRIQGLVRKWRAEVGL